MENKTHYSKVFKSDHLGACDLEEMIEEKKPLIFTIKEVKQYKGEIVNGKMKGQISVAGKNIDANIAYFVENIKPLVLNATNSKTIKRFANNSPFLEDWKNIIIELYVDENVKMKGEIVSGVRIRPVQPKTKQKPIFTEDKIAGAKAKNATIEQIEAVYTISEELKKKYNDYTGK